jgi:hypothetical protein
MASMNVGLDVNMGKTVHMLLSCHQIAGQNHDIKRAETFSLNEAKRAQFSSHEKGIQNLFSRLFSISLDFSLSPFAACTMSILY